MAGEKIVQQALKAVRELNPLGLFSRATEEAAKIPQAKGTPTQMRAALLKQGVKPDELKWTGFDDWVKDKQSVTRDEVADFLRRNQVRVEESVLGDNPRAAVLEARKNEINREIDKIAEAEIAAGRIPADNPRFQALESEFYDITDRQMPLARHSKFDDYTLPGGENYREVLIKYVEPPQARTERAKSYVNPNTWANMTESQREEFLAASDKGLYRSSHWRDDPDVLAHLRFKNRTDPEGRRILHLEEIQSDWGQAARKEGIKDTSPEAVERLRNARAASAENARAIEDKFKELIASGVRYDQAESHPELLALQQKASELQNAVIRADKATREGVSPAPFVESTPKWTDFALKRALREAVEGNYDALAWTPGAQQAARYPGVAEKGMVGYYDNIVPKRLQELTRPMDPEARIGSVEISNPARPSTSGPEIDNLYRELAGEEPPAMVGGMNERLPSLNITPAMREKIKEGLPLFTMVPGAVGLGMAQQGAEEPREGFQKGGRLISEALDLIRKLPPAENSRLTQIATTGPSYRKALSHLERAGIEGRAIDYGAGRGHGLREIGADTFEPYPQGWSPTYTKPDEIPDEVYRRLVNLNVLNVLDPQARESAVLNMGRIVEPGGGGVISTRGRDVMSARGEPGPEPMSLIIGEGDQARYQKGFTPRELRDYVGDTLGSRFDIEPSDVGQASVMFRRNREDGGEVRDGYDKGGVVKKALKAVADLFGTPEMEKWRGKSVIPSSRVEDRYFTGTSKDKDFANFNVGRHGVWLTKDPAEASMYALQNDSMGYRYGPSGIEKTNTASRVIPVFARAENPYTGELPDFALKQNYKRAQSEWFDQLRSQGHDAWLPENNPNLAVILRDPEQIKSAISNTGEFSGPRIDRAEGGRLLEDEYPTHYLPNVGRQVMADGGTPDDDIRRYEARMADIARQPEDIRSMTHAPSRPMRPIQIEGGLIGKRTLGEAPYDVAGPLSGIAQTAYSLKTLPFYFTPAAPFAAAADFGEAAIDTAKAAREGDYLGAGITGALGVAMPGYAYRKPIGDVVGRALNFVRGNPAAVGAGAAGAAVMTPEEAEAGKADIVRRGLEAARGVRAYHGSPHDFDRFDLSKIGTGEGAQAYGHGLYFAENEGVARGYRDQLSGNRYVPKISSNEIAQKYGEDVANIFEESAGSRGDITRTLARLQNIVARDLYDAGVKKISDIDGSFNPLFAEELRKVNDRAERLASLVRSKDVDLSKGHMYEVNIRANPEQFLDWDKPLAQQNESVREAFLKAQAGDDPLLRELLNTSPEGLMMQGIMPGAKGSAAYKTMASDDASPLRASQRLLDAGIPGIRYLDAGSRGAGEGSRNYVVFDDKLIDILRKYAKGGVAKELGSSPRETVKS